MNRIAVMDLETDPFEHGTMIQPFVAGFYDGDTFISFWHQDCVKQLVQHLETVTEPLTIYAHNGGRFDFFWFLPYLNANLRIVNSRVIQAYIGHHELRDSFAIMPFPLETYKKTPIDYENFRANVRGAHREEITSYLRDDCVDLHTLATAFYAEFGDSLTVGSAAMKQLKKFHSFVTGGKQYDERFRKDFYFGGRNQVFQNGIIIDKINVYDVNSMYPHVMDSFLHPLSVGVYVSNKIEVNTAFLSVTGRNFGAFPTRLKDHSLDFTIERGTFHTTIHEFNAALETGTFKPDRILKTFGFSRRETFSEFVQHFYNARMKAKAEGDKIRTIFYKFVLNSAYGKFAQNPENYCDWYITERGELPPDYHECSKSCEDLCNQKWAPSFINGNYIIWERPIKQHFYFNIATGASITGAARAVLLRGLSHAVNPYYCDTDSIICRDLPGTNLSDVALGAWKLEASGSMAAICGKKLYAIFDEDGTCIKKAHKGARLTGDEIISIANGNEVESCNPVPTFKWDGTHSFTKRTIRRTGQHRNVSQTHNPASKNLHR